jgi:cytoskeletal protein RodZ
MGRHEMSLGSSTLSEREEEMPMAEPIKQQEKRQLITPTRVLIGVAIFCILAMASYKVYTITFPAPSESKIIQSHGKMIQNAESSSGRETSSQTGSQSSGGSKGNKPLGVATTVGKDVISSNPGSGSDGEDE